MRHLHWWLLSLFLAYLGSGITTIQPDEVAVVLRFGEIHNRDTAQAIRQPGLLWAFPKPIDEVVRIKTQKVYQQEIKGLHFTAMQAEGQPLTFLSATSIDPERVGYALTGDGNIVHLSFLAHYQIVDPIAYALHLADPADLIKHSVQSAAIQNVGKSAVDYILSEGRQELIDAIAEQAQTQLEMTGAGVVMVSLEVIDFVPPYQVKADFNSVQSADIEAQTVIQRAEEYKVAQIPLADSEKNKKIQQARSYANALLSEAQGAATGFEVLLGEYQQNPDVVRSRLYREGIEMTLKDIGAIQFVPPPQKDRYQEGFRITVSAKGSR